MEAIDEIASVPGLDVVLIGPQDLSISLGIPLGLVAGLAPCAVLVQNALSRNFEDYQAFSAQLQSTVRGEGATGTGAGTIPTTQVNILVGEADRIWDNLAHGKRYLAIGYAVWTAFAAVLLLFYIPAGGYMLTLVRRQVLLQRHKIAKTEQNNLEIPVLTM